MKSVFEGYRLRVYTGWPTPDGAASRGQTLTLKKYMQAHVGPLVLRTKLFSNCRVFNKGKDKNKSRLTKMYNWQHFQKLLFASVQMFDSL